MNINTDIKEKLRNIYAEVLQLDSEDIVDGPGLVERLSIQSLQALQLIVKIENEFGIVIIDEEEMIHKLDEIDELQQYIATLL